MSLKNCPKCKRLFSPKPGHFICPECEKQDEQEFQKVREYLRKNRGADINVVSEETGVSTKKILKYLREGKLEVSEGMKDLIKCEKCGVSIRNGQFCRKCSEEVSKQFSSLLAVEQIEKNGPKMHIRK